MPEAIPQYPELADLTREHKPAIDAALAQTPADTSELTFTNLFIWRHAYGAKVTRIGDVLCLLSWRPDPEESFLLPPLGNGAGVQHVRMCLELLSSQGHAARLCRVDEATMARLGITTGEFEVTPDRDNWDYVYRVSDLIELSDLRYQDKRRHIERFTPQVRRGVPPDHARACSRLSGTPGLVVR